MPARYSAPKSVSRPVALLYSFAVADFGAGTLTLPDGTVEHYEEDVNRRYLREMDYFLDYAFGTEKTSLNSPRQALEVLKLTQGQLE